MTNFRRALPVVFTALFTVLAAGFTQAQSLTVSWPLNSTTQQAATSSAPALATGSAEQIVGGPPPAILVFDYWNGPTQRLWSGTTGWIAGAVNPGRYLQFDAMPAPGTQLTVSAVSLRHGGEGSVGRIRSEVRYSTDNWSTSTLLNAALPYPQATMASVSMPVSAPAVLPGGKFSLRIFPYAISSSTAAAPTFAGHDSVSFRAVSAPAGGGGGEEKKASFVIRKSTGNPVVPGTYQFTVTCHGANGIPTGSNIVNVVLPSPGFSTVNVPPGSICGIVETQPAGTWNPPVFSGGGGLNVQMGGPWEAKAGVINGNGGAVLVTNRPGKIDTDGKKASFVIRKTTGSPVVAGTYQFTVTCQGPGGPYAGPNPVNVVLPSPGFTSVDVPGGSVCGVIETQPVGNWDAPVFTGGGGLNVQMGAPWEAKAGIINGNGGAVLVANRPRPGTSAGACPVYEFTANLDVGTQIPSTLAGVLNPQTNNGTVEKFCYGDNAAKCATYGGLYEWREAMGYAASNNSDLTGPRVQGICPVGHHIPSDAEWARHAYCTESGVAPAGPTPLATFQNMANFSWMGSTTPAEAPGTKMKVASGSFSPPWTGSNSSGFGALPSGSRTMSVGTYASEGAMASYWTATQSSATRGTYFALDMVSSSGRIGRNNALKEYGMAVRCLKDY